MHTCYKNPSLTAEGFSRQGHFLSNQSTEFNQVWGPQYTTQYYSSFRFLRTRKGCSSFEGWMLHDLSNTQGLALSNWRRSCFRHRTGVKISDHFFFASCTFSLPGIRACLPGFARSSAADALKGSTTVRQSHKPTFWSRDNHLIWEIATAITDLLRWDLLSSIKNWMGPYQRTPKEVARAIRFSGLGVRSVGPVGDFLDTSTVM